MLLLNLTLCCFQMCIPSNETQKFSQNDLYVLETVGGMETRLETHQAPHGEPWEMGCFTKSPPREGRGAEEEPWVGGGEGKQPIQVQGHLGNAQERGNAFTSFLS